jgi:hypothetical protein
MCGASRRASVWMVGFTRPLPTGRSEEVLSERAKLLAIPTTYTLDATQVQALIDVGSKVLDSNAEFRRL